MLKDWLNALAHNRNLTGEDFRVMLFLMANVNYTVAEISQAEIARELELKPQNVSRAVKKLEANKVLVRAKKAGRVYAFRFIGFEEET